MIFDAERTQLAPFQRQGLARLILCSRAVRALGIERGKPRVFIGR
jgi:hypothetical protein